MQRLSLRVLARLVYMESHERDVWLREDYRLAWQTVLHAARGHVDPSGFSFWMKYGIVRAKYLAQRTVLDELTPPLRLELPPKKPAGRVSIAAPSAPVRARSVLQNSK